MPEPEHGDLRRLGERVRTERMARAWSKEAAARHAKMSSVTWNRVEVGKRVDDVTYAKIATVYRWKPDGLLRIMAGLEPELTDEPGASESEPNTVEAIKSDDRLTDDDKARLIDLYERMRGDDDGHGRGTRLA